MTNFVMTIYDIMNAFGKILTNWRRGQGLTMLDLSSLAKIDQALISKYENGQRMPSEKHITQLAKATSIPLAELRKEYLADRIVKMIQYEENPLGILLVAESRAEYLRSELVLAVPELSKQINEKLEAVDILRNSWNNIKPMSGIHLEKLKEYFSVRYTFDSNRIEGNTLTLQETHLVINEGITIGGKSVREHLEAINHADAIEWMQELALGQEEVNRRNLLDLHRLILRSIDMENAGKYRQVPVRISGSEHIPPEPYLLEKMMEDFFTYYEKQRQVLHPIILAAELHERLVSIHPFIDGNGRTARLLMNFILIRSGYTVVILKGDPEARRSYYQALESVQLDNNPEPFYHLILDRAKASLEEHLAMV
jgi:Fic family protein